MLTYSISAQSRTEAAKRRASAANARVIAATRRGVKWKILRFLAQPSVAAWTALFYIVISSIGITYSGAFYFRFDELHIFDFFGTPDFLLSAFRDIKTLTIGLVATLGCIGLVIYRTYNSGIYRAYNSDIYRAYTGKREKQEARVQRETSILVAIALVAIALVAIFFISFRWDKLFLLDTVLYLLSVSPLIIFAYRLIQCADSPINGDKPETRLNWEVGTLVSIILIEGLLILPFLSGVDDSKAALEKESRPVQVTLRRGVSGAGMIPPDRTLFLGTTSSFHFLYECGEALIDENGEALKNEDGTPKKCENGRPFVIPTANIASLEFKPKKEENVPTHGGLSDVVTAINDLGGIVQNLPISVGENSCASDWEKVETISPFCAGEHDQLEKDKEKIPNRCPGHLVIPDQFFTKIKAHLKDKKPQHLMLIGRVDNTLFSAEKREFYGTQIKLAKARAQWVHGELLRKFPKQIDPNRIILETAGPRHVETNGKKVSPEERALDRSVEIYACWTPREPKQASVPANPAQ